MLMGSVSVPGSEQNQTAAVGRERGGVSAYSGSWMERHDATRRLDRIMALRTPVDVVRSHSCLYQ